MRVPVITHYLGRDENKKAVVNFDKSGTYVLGVYANVQACCLCVLKGYDKNIRWDIIEEFYVECIDVEKCIEKSNHFIKKFKIRHLFGNTIGNSICDVKNDYSKGDLIRGYEVVELDPEHMMFLAQANLKKINIKEDLKLKWENEFKKFSIDDLRNNKVTYARIFALCNILHSAKIVEISFGDPDIPNILITNKTKEINELRTLDSA
jgi:hypothetical protein